MSRPKRAVCHLQRDLGGLPALIVPVPPRQCCGLGVEVNWLVCTCELQAEAREGIYGKGTALAKLPREAEACRMRRQRQTAEGPGRGAALSISLRAAPGSLLRSGPDVAKGNKSSENKKTRKPASLKLKLTEGTLAKSPLLTAVHTICRMLSSTCPKSPPAPDLPSLQLR